MGSIAYAKVWSMDGKTGGSATDLDSAGSGSEHIAENHIAWVIGDFVAENYKCVSSGATADGDLIIEPVAQALTNSGDADLRWHKRPHIVVSTSIPDVGDMDEGQIWLVVE